MKPTNALILKLCFYTQSIRNMTYFSLSWSSLGSYLTSIKLVQKRG